MNQKVKLAVAAIILAGVAGYLYLNTESTPQRISNIPKSSVPSALPTETTENPQPIESIATGLNVPWALAFLPDGSMLVTQRGGTREVG